MPRERPVIARLLSKDFLARVWARANEDDILGRGAQLSYFFLLALFPLLLFLITLFGYFSSTGSYLRDALVSYLASVVPPTALLLIINTLDEVTNARGSGKLSFGLLVALWAASSGMGAIGDALNAAYRVRETRSWWKVRLISLTLTVTLSMLIVSALLIVLYGGRLGDVLAALVGFGPAFAAIWKVLQWPIALVFVFITFALIYRFAPNLQSASAERRVGASDYRRRWLSPGVVVAVMLWLLVSLAFRFYLHFFNSYSATYGSLGALIVLMLWFYLTGIAILMGGEINCELESAGEKIPKTPA